MKQRTKKTKSSGIMEVFSRPGDIIIEDDLGGSEKALQTNRRLLPVIFVAKGQAEGKLADVLKDDRLSAIRISANNSNQAGGVNVDVGHANAGGMNGEWDVFVFSDNFCKEDLGVDFLGDCLGFCRAVHGANAQLGNVWLIHKGESNGK